MRNKKQHVDPIPEEFGSYEKAAEFWDVHDTTHYLDDFETVNVLAEFRRRHYEVQVDEDVIVLLQERAAEYGITIDHLVSDMLRQQLSPAM